MAKLAVATVGVLVAHSGLSRGLQVSSLQPGNQSQAAYDELKQLGATSHLHSFILQQNGQVVEEQYWNGGVNDNPFYLKWPHGGGPNEQHFMLSVSKTMSAFSMARAIQKGYVSLKAPLVQYLDVNRSTLATGADMITVEDAMSMKSGLNPSSAKDGFERMLSESPPVRRGTFKYQDADPTLLWYVIDQACPGGALAFLSRDVFGPLGIHNFDWETGDDNVPFGGAGLFWSARAMLTVGQVMLDGGKYNGQQFVPPSYVAGAFAGTGYTNMWHHDVGFSYSAGGGGNYIFVAPDKNVVMVTTGADENLMGTVIDLFEAIHRDM